jgi:hypothetical protein
MSDKNHEQRINIKFCLKIGKSASGTLALLTVACGECVVKKTSVFERPKKWAAENVKGRCKYGQSTNKR